MSKRYYFDLGTLPQWTADDQAGWDEAEARDRAAEDRILADPDDRTNAPFYDDWEAPA